MKLLKWLRHYLVPHQSNNHKAKILHPSTLSVLVVIFLVYQFGINLAVFFQPSILGYASSITPERVVDLTNQERLKQGLAPLTINPTLSQAAQMKAGDMFAFNYWAHNSPSGRTPWDFFKQAGYRYVYAGENLARDFQNSEAVVEAWMNSSSHKDNIVNGKYREIGLAVVNGTLGGVETTLVVQMFGTPTPAAVAQKPAETQGVSLNTGGQSASTVKKAIPTILPTPTALPTILPTPTPRLAEMFPAEGIISSAPTILAQAKNETVTPPLLSPFWLTKTAAIFLLGIILGVLALDIWLVYRRKIVRLSGRNLAHLLFITALLLAVILTTPGAII